jgi:hypothetical protein
VFDSKLAKYDLIRARFSGVLIMKKLKIYFGSFAVSYLENGKVMDKK